MRKIKPIAKVNLITYLRLIELDDPAARIERCDDGFYRITTPDETPWVDHFMGDMAMEQFARRYSLGTVNHLIASDRVIVESFDGEGRPLVLALNKANC